MSEPITNVPDAVTALGALPVPQGPAPQPDPIAEGRRLDLLALMDERAASKVSPVLAAVLDEADRLRLQVAALLAERHVTNEALDDAVQALRARQAEREVLVERMRAGQQWRRGRSPELVSENLVSQSELREIFGIPLAPPLGDADALTRTFVPVAALREGGEHYEATHHTYALGRDLPNLGGGDRV